MIIIKCPWCGLRSEEEFCYGGQSNIARPPAPAEASDEEWSAYLYNRENPAGRHCERWRHTYGCGQWFNLVRDTISHEVIAVYRMGDDRPKDVAGDS